MCIMSDFNETIFFSTNFSKNTEILELLDNPSPVGKPSFFHAVGRTNMTKLIVGSRNFASAPKKRASTAA